MNSYAVGNKANIGSHVRLHLAGKAAGYMHSYTVVGVSSTGIKVYDANWDNRCGIRIADVTWEQIYKMFDYISYTDVFGG